MIPIKNTKPDGKESTITIDEFVDAKMRRLESATIDKTAGTVTVTLEGSSIPIVFNYIENGSSITYTHPDGFSTTISII